MKGQRLSSSGLKTRKLFIASIALLLVISGWLYYRSINSEPWLPVNVEIKSIALNKYDGYDDRQKSEPVLPSDNADTSVSHAGSRTREWMNQNLFRVHSYTENPDGTFDVQLLEIDGPEVDTWQQLVQLFMSTPYSDENSAYISDGVNCQGMTLFLAEWCETHDHTYTVQYMPTHVRIVITHEGEDFLFSFSSRPVYKALNDTNESE